MQRHVGGRDLPVRALRLVLGDQLSRGITSLDGLDPARDVVLMVEVEADKTGRITIPATLREYAGLDRDVVVVGVDTRFEIWDAATWAAYEAEQEAVFAAMESEGMPTLS